MRPKPYMSLALAALTLASCTPSPLPPKVEGLAWDIKPADDQKFNELHLKGRFEPQSGGIYLPSVETVDERGCARTTTALTPITVAQSGETDNVIKLDLTRRIATATLRIYFEPTEGGGQPQQVFTGNKVIDPDIRPRTDIKDPCGPSPAEKRAKEQELRKIDAEMRKRERQKEAERKQQAASHGGYGSAALRERGEMIATVLNLNGLLCARVVAVEPLRVSSDAFEVTCVEYRGGTGTVRYIVNASDGTAFRP